MICYVKTIHSHTIAEIFKRNVQLEASIAAGSICQLEYGYLTNKLDSTLPKYLVIEDKKSDDGKKQLDCIRLVPGMVLKGTHDIDPESVRVGVSCTFTTDLDDRFTVITTGGNDAELLDIDAQTVTILINK